MQKRTANRSRILHELPFPAWCEQVFRGDRAFQVPIASTTAFSAWRIWHTLIIHPYFLPLHNNQQTKGMNFLCGVGYVIYAAMITATDPWGPEGPSPLAPKILFKSCSFQAILSIFWAQAPLGSKLCWAPMSKILDPRLRSIRYRNARFVHFSVFFPFQYPSQFCRSQWFTLSLSLHWTFYAWDTGHKSKRFCVTKPILYCAVVLSLFLPLLHEDANFGVNALISWKFANKNHFPLTSHSTLCGQSPLQYFGQISVRILLESFHIQRKNHTTTNFTSLFTHIWFYKSSVQAVQIHFYHPKLLFIQFAFWTLRTMPKMRINFILIMILCFSEETNLSLNLWQTEIPLHSNVSFMRHQNTQTNVWASLSQI